jgi:hypothetical protein
MRAHIDTDTGRVAGIDTETRYTRDEIATLRISCPVCGSRVSVAPVPVGSLEDSGPRQFAIGRARCARGCDFTAAPSSGQTEA